MLLCSIEKRKEKSMNKVLTMPDFKSVLEAHANGVCIVDLYVVISRLFYVAKAYVMYFTDLLIGHEMHIFLIYSITSHLRIIFLICTCLFCCHFTGVVCCFYLLPS